MGNSPGVQLDLSTYQPIPQAAPQGSNLVPSKSAGVKLDMSTFQPSQQTQPKEEPGAFAKAWDWATKPIMSRGNFIAGMLTGNPNNEQVAGAINAVLDKAKEYSKSAPSGFDVNHPIISSMLKGYAGAESDAADVAGSATSPVSIATMGAGAASEVPGAIGTLGKVALPVISAGFAGKGASNIYAAGTENTPKAWEQRLTGAAMVAGGAAGVGQGVKNFSRVQAPLGETVNTPSGTGPAENFTPAELKAYANENDIPLNAAQATEHTLPRGLQSAGERSIIGGTAVKAQVKAAQAAIAEHAQELSDSFYPNAPDLASKGAAIQEGVQEALAREQGKARAAYAAIDKQAGGVTVDLTPVKTAAEKALSNSQFVRSVGLDPKTATGILQQVSEMPDAASFSEAQDLRSALLDASRSPDLAMANRAQGWIKQLTGATDAQMMAAAKAQSGLLDIARGTPGLEDAFRDANAHWKQLQQDFNEPSSVLNRILSESDPNKVPGKLTQRGQIGGSPYNAQLLDKYGIDKGPIKSAILDDLTSKDFRLWGKNLGGYSDSFLRSVFSPDELDAVYKTGAIARRVGLNQNPSGTAGVSSAIEQTVNPLKLGAQWGAAKATNSPGFNNWMMQSGAGRGRLTTPLSVLLALSRGKQGED